ncbi:hypothetical protein Q5H91_09080 [Sphingomonas sp. KR1UV-12]|uniref:Uncharacterized protein n=1 Tax=Sphingomonas aurea TaxID=3063994 RepID=A0ABT9EKI3_9SPHN|nr:hypothetical protein [Sphingomonas sp. KR1UV-12]MDP1027365.1 hypothetical protein [Sphingomonas sp. KR1UV-12]
MRRLIAVIALALPVTAEAAPTQSWGKPGAARAAFEAGGVECSLRAARADVAGRPETTAYVQGFEALERENNMPAMPAPAGDNDTFARAKRQVLLRRMYSPDKKVDALQTSLQGEVDACLTKAGYVRYTLTRDQDRRLRKLRPGSEERKLYLFTLGTDPEVVERQRVE